MRSHIADIPRTRGNRGRVSSAFHFARIAVLVDECVLCGCYVELRAKIGAVRIASAW
ncbi:MAG: hypothetical protein ACLTCP_12935 [Ruminococcus bicirculans (ex Wegman et al. 2014)]